MVGVIAISLLLWLYLDGHPPFSRRKPYMVKIHWTVEKLAKRMPNPTVETTVRHPGILYQELVYIFNSMVLPSCSCSLHVICNGDIFGPNVILPFSEANNSWQDVTCVNAYPHVHFNTMLLSKKNYCYITYFNFFLKLRIKIN